MAGCTLQQVVDVALENGQRHLRRVVACKDVDREAISQSEESVGLAGGVEALWDFLGVLAIQGFGSAITEAGWDTSFGVAGLLRAAQVPEWGTLLIGLAGAALLMNSGAPSPCEEAGAPTSVSGPKANHRCVASSWRDWCGHGVGISPC